MTEVEERGFRELFGVLDRPADPDPAFVRSLASNLADGQGDQGHIGRNWRRAMVPVVAAALAVSVLVGVVATRDGRQRTITGPPEPTTTTMTSGTTTTEAEQTTGEGPQGRPAAQLSGFLPDGTNYRIVAEPGLRPEVEGISAGIVVVDDQTDAGRAVGIIDFQQSGAETGVVFDDARVLASSGGWTMTISLYDDMVEALTEINPDLEVLFTSAIVPELGGVLPRFELRPPLRWATDIELPLAMEVVYNQVVIRRGCGESSVACSQRHGAQLIPTDRVVAPAEPWDDSRQVWIESDASRPLDESHWLPLGPLDPRGGHQVVWTGTEMIVWGGATSDRAPNLIDGAAYDPISGSWRSLPPPPIDQPATTVALWADSQMMVISPEATLAYDPTADTWNELGDGIAVGRPLWTGSDVALVTTDGVFRFDQAAGRWIELPGAPVRGIDYWWGSALASVGDELYLSQGCATRLSRWTGNEWQTVPSIPEAITDQSQYQFCPTANQWAALDGKLIVWEEENIPTVQFDPATDSWSEIDRIPVGGTEGPGGAVLLDGRLLAIGAGAAIYEPASNTWLPVELPGAAFAPDLVWTGSELLMWGGTCCYGAGGASFSVDAWRWTPPPPPPRIND